MDTIIEILIDKSGSMGFMKGSELHENKYLLKDGSTRTDLIKKMMIQEIIPTIDYANKVTIRTFTTIGEKFEQTEVKSIYDGHFDEEKIIETINSLENPPLGGTPISEALEKSIEELSNYKNHDRKIILLTDGEESGKGDYLETAKKAISLHGIPCKIFIVGLDQEESARTKAKQLADYTEGNYLNVNSINYNKEYFTSVFLPIKSQVLKSSLENLTSAKVGQNITQPNNTSNSLQNPQTEQKPLKELESINSEMKSSKIEVSSNKEDEIVPERPSEQIFEEKIELKEIVEKNSKALNLITKQLENLNQEIRSLKVNFDFYEEQEDIVIAENRELNEKVRTASERFVNEKLKAKYTERLRWLNENGESGADHDFEVLEEDTTIEYFIECKGTKSGEKIFLLTKNEWELFINNTKNYQVYFVYNALSSPSLIKIDNLLDWILKGKIYPFSNKNRKVKAERLIMTINEG